MTTVFDKWKYYRSNLPPTISVIQYIETKKAFWCGMAEMFDLVSKLVDMENLDVSAKYLEDMSKALQTELLNMVKK